MKPIPFNPEADLAPIRFSKRRLVLAREMKDRGLPWQPHVGCFVWDVEEMIQPDSPFPDQVYFILSLPRFLSIFGSREKMRAKLVWVPTWHQARLLCRSFGVPDDAAAELWRGDNIKEPGDETCALYKLLINAMNG
jgi:hypothetical protein